MAEFDVKGFSAVDEFFGGTTREEYIDNDERTKGKGKNDIAMNNNKRKRMGVGGSVLSSSKHDISTSMLENEVAKKRLLNVGRRKRNDDDEENFENELVVKARNIHDEEEEEEDDAGRTGISKTTNTNTRPNNFNPVPRPGQTTKEAATTSKKLGKKERKKRRMQEEIDNEATKDKQKSDMTTKTDQEEKIVTTATTAATTSEVDGRGKDGKLNNDTRKKKRKKTRSKQKNIRKDNRTKEQKPKHLIPGSSHYEGRPLTEETRKRLNLPLPSFQQQRNHQHRKLYDQHQQYPPADDDDRQQEGSKLAIEQFLSGHEENEDEGNGLPPGLPPLANDEELTLLNKKKPTKSNMKKKRKFKNLAM